MAETVPKYVVMIPSYNTGRRLRGTVESALKAWPDVWVVVDGSTDGSDMEIEPLTKVFRGLKILRKPKNGGKGSAVLVGARAALEAGFTHAVLMDADGQHPGASIPDLIAASRRDDTALIMGKPIFGPEVPKARLYGRRLTIFWTNVKTLWYGLGDTLFGMRVYPLQPLVKAMESTWFARGYDFDPEVAVRMTWGGCRPVQVPVPVRYFSREEGGVSHFNYLRDNIKMVFLHMRLLVAFLGYGIWKFLGAKKKWNRKD